MKVWFDNELIDSSKVALDADGWPEGIGIFETLRTEHGEVFELSRHMRRAIDAAERIGITLPNENLIREAIAKTLDAEPCDVGRLRLLFSQNSFAVVHKSYEDLRNAQKICTQSRASEIDGFVMKRYPYTERLQLLASVVSAGFDEVICYNPDDHITEGAVSNFLFLIDGQWVTSPLTSGVLPGVIRAIAIERCDVKVRNISKDEIPMIESAVVLSSLKIVLPVASIDERRLNVNGHVVALEEQIRAKTQKHSVG